MNNIRIDNLREKIRKAGVDCLLISKAENRRYYSGFSGSNGWLVISCDNAFIITDGRYFSQVQAEAPGFTLVKCLPAEGKSLFNPLFRLMEEFNYLRIGFEESSLTYSDYKSISDKNDKLLMIPSSRLIESARIIKSADEVGKIRHAVSIAEKAFSGIADMFVAGVSEIELSAKIDYLMKINGADKEGFDTIVASGPNGAMPHAKPTGRRFQAGDAVTVDWGARFQGYHSDMTRTVFIGKPKEKTAEIYRIVLESQERALEKIKPGITCREADGYAREVIEKAGYGQYFSHGLGHGVGLAIHEAPTIGQNQETVLEPGMIITVEPGVYVPDIGGVRIEDICLVTDGGIEVLTSLPKQRI